MHFFAVPKVLSVFFKTMNIFNLIFFFVTVSAFRTVPTPLIIQSAVFFGTFTIKKRQKNNQFCIGLSVCAFTVGSLGISVGSLLASAWCLWTAELLSLPPPSCRSAVMLIVHTGYVAFRFGSSSPRSLSLAGPTLEAGPLGMQASLLP